MMVTMSLMYSSVEGKMSLPFGFCLLPSTSFSLLRFVSTQSFIEYSYDFLAGGERRRTLLQGSNPDQLNLLHGNIIAANNFHNSITNHIANMKSKMTPFTIEPCLIVYDLSKLFYGTCHAGYWLTLFSYSPSLPSNLFNCLFIHGGEGTMVICAPFSSHLYHACFV